MAFVFAVLHFLPDRVEVHGLSDDQGVVYQTEAFVVHWLFEVFALGEPGQF